MAEYKWNYRGFGTAFGGAIGAYLFHVVLDLDILIGAFVGFGVLYGLGAAIDKKLYQETDHENEK